MSIRTAAVAVVVTCAGMAGCQAGEPQSTIDNGEFRFAVSEAPTNFDPLFNQSNRTFFVVRQMFETLLTHRPGTAELAPGLAEGWTRSPDGKTITFVLRSGVRFHDGTALDAAAVCFNLDRWYRLDGEAAQSRAVFYTDIFDGFAVNRSKNLGKPIYRSCRATDQRTAVMTLNEAKGVLPAALTLPAFGISSPTALRAYDADRVARDGDALTYNPYADAHPTGTGPYKFSGYDRQNRTVTLVRNDTYWGPRPKLDRVVFKVIPDATARKQELLAGTIDAYDLPAPADYAPLRAAGFQLLIRPPFNIAYLGINQAHPVLADVRVRRAIAHAINREQLVSTILPAGAQVAHAFVPPAMPGHPRDVTTYDYDPAKAMALLTEAGVQGLTLRLHYPTDVSPAYLPDPRRAFTLVADDLRRVGITVQPVAKPFAGGYLSDVKQTTDHDLHFGGWNGDYADAGNFVGTFFGGPTPQFGLRAPELFAALAAADAAPTEAAKAAAYEQVNRDIMSEYLPGVPIAHTPTAIAAHAAVTGLIPSPVYDEKFIDVAKA